MTDLRPGLSRQQHGIPLGATFQAASRVRALRAEGRDIISLTLGEPDFASPPHAIEAAHLAALRGETKYPPVSGTAALKQAIRAKFLRDSGLRFVDCEIIVSHGARQVIYDALVASLDAGDEVIVPAPYWNAYPLIARMQGAAPVFVPCNAASLFLPDPDAIGRAITPRTKWLVLNFPNNPSGAVCSAAHLRAIADVLRGAPHVWVMSDDMYEHLVHDGSANATIACVAPELADRVLTISGVSKTYAMTGWRVGFAGGPARLIGAMTKVQGQSSGGVSPMAQAAAVAALEGSQEHVGEMRFVYGSRARIVAGALNAIEAMHCTVPAGAFYLYPGLAGLLGKTTPAGRILDTDEAFCSALLEEAGVSGVHGGAFGLSPHLRLSIAADDASLAMACRRIAAFCGALR